MSGKDDRPPSFADVVGDVKPLADRDKIAPRPEPSATPGTRAADANAEPRNFVVEVDGDWIQGRAEDVSLRQLADYSRPKAEGPSDSATRCWQALIRQLDLQDPSYKN